MAPFQAVQRKLSFSASAVRQAASYCDRVATGVYGVAME